MIEPYLPAAARRAIDPVRMFGLVLPLAMLSLPLSRDLFIAATSWLVDVTGAPVNGVYFGFELFRFWSW